MPSAAVSTACGPDPERPVRRAVPDAGGPTTLTAAETLVAAVLVPGVAALGVAAGCRWLRRLRDDV
jgi:hypothetical protein